MTDQEKRAAILSVYPGSPTWPDRIAKMTPEQVTAIYLRFKSQGKLS